MQRFKTMQKFEQNKKRIASDSDQLPAEGGRRFQIRDRRIRMLNFNLCVPQRFYTACHTNIDITI